MNNSRLVYSTEEGSICPVCRKPVQRCVCKKRKSSPPGPAAKADGIIRIRRETKGRKGKTVTTLSGFQMNDRDIMELASKLKHRCGTGGTAKDGIITIQGDHRQTVLNLIQKMGYPAKLAGG